MKGPPATFFMPSKDGYRVVGENAETISFRLNRISLNRQNDPVLTYGQYFRAIASVLARKEYQPLVQAVRESLGKKCGVADLDGIRVYAEKHGSDYHPARIEVGLGRERALFVMNVAATERGQHRLASEFQVLQRLTRRFDYGYLPKVFFQDTFLGDVTDNSAPGVLFTMFLGEWFEGCHEFHMLHGGRGMVLWDSAGGRQYLSEIEAQQVYEEASVVMTLYYDVDTFDQIFPWHHAAGDFVVSMAEGKPAVHLITARNYGPMIEPGKGIAVEEGLLFFLLNLSLRMRLDRFDGTGEVAWGPKGCVDATLKGFFKGLERQVREGRIPSRTRKAFFKLCHQLGVEAFTERFLALADACDPRAPDMPVIRQHLSEHISEFLSALASWGQRF